MRKFEIEAIGMGTNNTGYPGAFPEGGICSVLSVVRKTSYRTVVVQFDALVANYMRRLITGIK